LPAITHPLGLDHDDFGLKQSKILNVIDSSLERDTGGKPVSTFPHPALELLSDSAESESSSRSLFYRIFLTGTGIHFG
jgi:hypothetical protein